MALRSSAPPRKTHPRPRPARWEAVAEQAGTSAALPATYPRSNDRAVTSRPAGRRQSLSESAHLPIAVPAGAVTRVKGSGHIGMVTFAKTILHRRSLAADGFCCSCRASWQPFFSGHSRKSLIFVRVGMNTRAGAAQRDARPADPVWCQNLYRARYERCGDWFSHEQPSTERHAARCAKFPLNDFSTLNGQENDLDRPT